MVSMMLLCARPTWSLLLSPSVTTQRRCSWTTTTTTKSIPCSSAKQPTGAFHLFASVSTSPPPSANNEGPICDNQDKNSKNNNNHPTVRSRFRKITGFSLTAFRASSRACVAAVYLATLTATGAWIRQLTKCVLSIFPPAVRYFFQPLLILYYAPLFILKNLTGPTTRQRAVESHEQLVEGWRAAVQKADDTVSYWPIHLAPDGKTFESDGTVELEEGISESVNVAMDITMEEDDDSNDATTTTTTSTTANIKGDQRKD
ncbi:hypothetical protein ACA910_020048 [Epithemia clementina (nom. ined.)]